MQKVEEYLIGKAKVRRIAQAFRPCSRRPEVQRTQCTNLPSNLPILHSPYHALDYTMSNWKSFVFPFCSTNCRRPADKTQIGWLRQSTDRLQQKRTHKHLNELNKTILFLGLAKCAVSIAEEETPEKQIEKMRIGSVRRLSVGLNVRIVSGIRCSFEDDRHQSDAGWLRQFAY